MRSKSSLTCQKMSSDKNRINEQCVKQIVYTYKHVFFPCLDTEWGTCQSQAICAHEQSIFR